MPNSSLENKRYKVPLKVTNRIKSALNKATINDKQGKGVKRAKDLVINKDISDSQMNRLKNYFDNYQGDGTDEEYKLIGGKVTSKWVEKTLGQNRDSIRNIKKAKMEGGMDNAFLKSHEKDNDNTNVTQANGGMIDIAKSSKMDRIMAGDAIYKSSSQKESYDKEIDSIKYLIEYMNK